MFQWIRPKELRDQYEQSQKLFALPPLDQCVGLRTAILDEWRMASSNETIIAPHVIQDAQLMDALTIDVPPGAAAWIRHQVAHPIHAIPQLTQRQADLRRCSGGAPPLLDADAEADVLWALDLPPLKKAWPLPLLYPQWFALRWLNHQPTLLNLYHLYRIYGAPLSHFVYPLTLFFGPWWYIRTKLKWPLPMKTYLQYLRKALVELIKIRTRDIREIVFKLVTLVVYVGIYIYGVIQSIDIALMLHQTRRLLNQRMARIQTFIAQTQSAWERLGLSESTWGFRAHPLGSAMTAPKSAYSLFQSSRFHPFLKDILVKAYTLQGIHAITTKAFQPVRWRPANKIQKPVLHFQAMGHPMLPAEQQRNPVLLSKNLILTGPNAAGKSTYVRGILANILMAQTFGVACARTATLTPFRTIASLMRVQDIVGTQSLFEAECRRSLELIQLAQAQPTHPMVLFLDEPMHATPPIEGAATAMALVKYLSQFIHTRLIVTTHYHVLSNLESLYPKRFRNVRMEATLNPIRFTYQLHPGASTQSIAIEMLEKDAFPPELLKDAIEFKNKICRVEDNTTSQ
jgi:cell division protein FtsL